MFELNDCFKNIRNHKRIVYLILIIIIVLAVVAGAAFLKIRSLDNAENEKTTFIESDNQTNILVVYFSKAGLQANGLLEKGNTAVVAEIIANQTGADIFELVSSDGHYPNDFLELQDVAKKDIRENARPEYVGEVENISKYDTIFIGSPVWYTEWPAIVYTFIENNDLSGKNLVPFDTYVGSGLHPLDEKLAEACPNSTVKEGIAIKGEDAQNKPDEVKNNISQWLSKLDLDGE